MKKAVAVLVLMLLAGTGILAQSYATRSKSAIKRFEKARECYSRLDHGCAEEALQKALKADPEFTEALQLMAQVCYDQGKIHEAIGYFERSLQVAPGENPDGYRLLAGLTMQTGDYIRTLKHIETFLEFPPEQVRNRTEGELIRRSCHFALEALKHPVPFSPENLGDSVNSTFNEYWPSLSVDEEMLMFTVMEPVRSMATETPRVQEDLYYSYRTEAGWEHRINAGPPLNSRDNEGAQTMTADGKILYFTACNRRDGKGKCDIYRTERRGERWSEPVNIGSPVNSRYSEKHPAISADGRKLYFASDRPGGYGSFDIWVSTWTGDRWGQPVNLGDSINTAWMEQSPFIHPDQLTLYFSSNGWPGMGQGDLFMSRINPSGEWSSPRNLGYPVNTYSDDIGLSVSAGGNRAFFASDRDSARGTDLFTFELPEAVRPVPVSYMKGRVYDSGSRQGVPARLQLIDIETEEVVMELGSEKGSGGFLLSLPTNREYVLNVTAEGYLFYSEHFTFPGNFSELDPYRRDIPLERIDEGSRVVLRNIFFDIDSHTLKPTSRTELNKVADYLLAHPSLEVEIGGHTDSTGSSAYNQDLSERRASAVVEYLAGRGVIPGKLKAKGYGDTKPVGDNTTEAGRAKNRRTELKILRILHN
jgi:outer membrane protein OmpA-like peptidoglycan-associated protein